MTLIKPPTVAPPNPHKILAAARLLIYERAPYFRAGVLQLVPRETPGLGTFVAPKDWILLWDPEQVVEWGVEGTAAAIVHELWHLLRDHFGRFSEPLVDRDLANIAGDLAINPGVAHCGFKLPESALFPSMLKFSDDLTAEGYYEKLQGMVQKGQVSYVYDDGKTAGRHNGPIITIHGCGSCSGRPIQGEPQADPEGRSEAESRQTRITIAKAIRQAGRGTVPADLARWAEEALAPPKVRWEEKLARACRASAAYRPGSGMSTYSRVSRRQAGVGFGAGKPVIPAVRATHPRVTFLVDTSGSMGARDLAAAMAEAQGVFRACGAVMTVIVCDADVHGARTVRSIPEACKMLRGGGGSDFRPAFDLIAGSKPRTGVVVAATDGDITVPAEEPPGTKVIWLLVNGNHPPAAWGTAIVVER